MKDIKALLRLLKPKSIAGLLVVAGVSLAMCSSCTEESMSDASGDKGVIRFELTADSEDDNTLQSRAACIVESPVLLYAHNSDTFYLHTTVTDNHSPVAENPATRGIPANTGNFKSVYGAFGVKAYIEGTTTLYMDDKVSTESGGIWSPDGNERFWPGKQALDFYARAPYEHNGKKPLDNEEVSYSGKKISFSYTVPTTTDGNDAKAQPDLMFAFASHSVETANNGRVHLKFQHALAAIKFETLDIAGGTIESISIKGISGAGRCIYDASNETKFAWTPTGDPASFSQYFNKQVNDQQAGSQEITGSNSETTFMMVPQALDGESVIEVVMKTKDGITHTLTAPLKGHTWEAGKIYTYTISTESINWTYVFDVTPTLTLPLGTTSGQYNVRSYRYRTQNPSVKEPVAWTAELQGNTYKNEIKSFTYQGNGTTYTAGDQYKCSLTLPSMNTSYKGDKTLSDATPKGTSDNPYDLSTENGKQAQTTANCYVTSAAGTYSLPLVYGNAIRNGSPNTTAYSGASNNFCDYKNQKITSPYINGASDCVLVWSDAFYLFKDVRLSGNKLVFTLDQKYMQQANAIVAVRDKDRKIMWSWHIWVTEKDISQTIGLQDFATDTKDKYQLMTCNLGWIDGKTITYQERKLPFTFTQERSGKNQSMIIVQEGAKLDYKDGGSTYYQWGRKDPIVALKNRNATGAEDYRPHETGQDNYGYTCRVSKTTIGDAIQNPNVFYIDQKDGARNWLSSPVYYLWDNRSVRNLDDNASTKTIYDPSPRGFKVPMPRAFSVFVNGHNKSEAGGTLNGTIVDDHTYNVYSQKNKKGTAITLTATGQRVDRVGGIDGAGPGGLWAMDGVYYWTCYGGYNGTYYGISLCIRNISPAWYTYGFVGAQTMARPVRCIKE